MHEYVSLGDEVRNRIRFGLDQLRADNRHHDFEPLCLAFANARLGGHFVPATGPVSSGGDRGRDFESYRRVDARPDEPKVAVLCTTQQKGLPAKIRADLAKNAGVADLVYAFLTADLPVSQIHALQAEAEANHGIHLEVFDGNRLATLMATSDLAEMAYRLLRIDVRELRSSTRTGDEYLIALRTSGLRQGWPQAGDLAPREAFYQPQLLRGPDGQTRTWEEALETGGNLVLTGPSGTGKSMLLRHVATTLAQRRLDGDQHEWHPVLLHARHLARHGSLVDALFHGATEAVAPELHRPLAPDHFDRMLPSGRWLVLVDGLDEVQDGNARSAVLTRLRTAAALPSMRVVVTSRPLHQRDHKLLSATFTEHILNALDNAGIESFVARWFSRTNQAPQRRAALALLSTADQWMHTPLMASMICTLASEAPARPLPTQRTAIYEAFVDYLVSKLPETTNPTITAVQDQVLDLMAAIAFHVQVDDIEADLLDLAEEWLEERDVPVPPRMRAQWRGTISAVLTESGLISATGTTLAFAHPSLQEYFAALHLSGSTPEEVVATLKSTADKYFYSDEHLLGEREFIRFLMDHVGDDRLASELLTAFPLAMESLAQVLDNRELGRFTEESLHSLAEDQHQFLETRVAAAEILDDHWPGQATTYQLALSVNVDLEESDRLDIIRALVRQRGPAAAAVQWLTFQEYNRYPNTGYHHEAIPLVTTGPPSTADRKAGLALVARTGELDDAYRVDACAALAEHDPDEAYRLFNAMRPTTLTVSHLIDSHEPCSLTLLRHFALDDEQPFKLRFDAIEELEDTLPEFALDLYEELAQSPTLSPGQREQLRRAAQLLEP
ncbi:NACHT domain-containing protein [Lentzea albida]|uniref:NACHT domain-containing protein n=1 Tax=Lentzea albida TaxID=65499 RepID=A0A1H9X5Q5_9PSEU|nr:NACHT domain-containing protein [Lentzea albida]SES41472.1 NACHT domain-containing protein [Lentzea albida]